MTVRLLLLLLTLIVSGNHDGQLIPQQWAIMSALISMAMTAIRRDVEGGGGARGKRSNRSYVDPRNFLVLFALLSCLATMLLLYSRVSAV